jgi:biotin carboxylase
MFGDRKKILILGAGRDQVPIIKKAKDLGLFVIVVSPKGSYDGFSFADKVFYADIKEKDKILEFAKNEGIDGVASDQLDAAVQPVAYIAEKLKLAGIGYDCSQYFTNKLLMRRICQEIGIPVHKYKEAKDLEHGLWAADTIGFPVVIKPVDSSGSRGVLRIDNEEEFKEKFGLTQQESFAGMVLIEEYLNGEQFLTRGYIDNYNLRLFAFANRYYFRLSKLFLPNLTIFPAKIESSVKERMVNYYNRLIEKLKPKFGASGIEWIYNLETDKLHVIEISIRGGGAFIGSDLMPQAYGIDIQPYLINACLNQKYENIFDAHIENRASAYMFFLLPEGRVSYVEGIDQIEKIKGVFKSYVKNIKVGNITDPLVNKGSRIGPILISGETRDEVEETISEIRRRVKVKIETNAGQKDVIWE